MSDRLRIAALGGLVLVLCLCGCATARPNDGPEHRPDVKAHVRDDAPEPGTPISPVKEHDTAKKAGPHEQGIAFTNVSNARELRGAVSRKYGAAPDWLFDLVLTENKLPPDWQDSEPQRLSLPPLPQLLAPGRSTEVLEAVCNVQQTYVTEFVNPYDEWTETGTAKATIRASWPAVARQLTDRLDSIAANEALPKRLRLDAQLVAERLAAFSDAPASTKMMGLDHAVYGIAEDLLELAREAAASVRGP
jgi:hypothetical protein